MSHVEYNLAPQDMHLTASHGAIKQYIFPLQLEDALPSIQAGQYFDDVRFLDAQNDAELSQAIALSVDRGGLNSHFSPNDPEGYRTFYGNRNVIGHIVFGATQSELKAYRERVATASLQGVSALNETVLLQAADREVIKKERLLELMAAARLAIDATGEERQV